MTIARLSGRREHARRIPCVIKPASGARSDYLAPGDRHQFESPLFPVLGSVPERDRTPNRQQARCHRRSAPAKSDLPRKSSFELLAGEPHAAGGLLSNRITAKKPLQVGETMRLPGSRARPEAVTCYPQRFRDAISRIEP